VDTLLDASTTCKSGKQVADIARVNLLAAQRAEDGAGATNGKLLSGLHPPLKESGSSGVKTDNPALVSFSMLDGNRARIDINILRAQCEHFTDAQSTPPCRCNQRSVADAGWRTVRAAANQPLYLSGS
jgi:hypothetical protein